MPERDPYLMLERLRGLVARCENEALSLEIEIDSVEQRLSAFQDRYDREVLPGIRRLEVLKAAIADAEAKLEARSFEARFGSVHTLEKTWEPPQGYVSVEDQYQRMWGEPDEIPVHDPDPTPKPHRTPPREPPGDALKRLYRALVRRYHPDLAESAQDRAARTEMMIHINAAYAARDLEALRALSGEKESDEVPAESILRVQLRELQAAFRRANQRLEELKQTHYALLNNQLMNMLRDAEQMRRGGRDLIDELASELEQEYWRGLEQLDRLRARLGE